MFPVSSSVVLHGVAQGAESPRLLLDYEPPQAFSEMLRDPAFTDRSGA